MTPERTLPRRGTRPRTWSAERTREVRSESVVEERADDRSDLTVKMSDENRIEGLGLEREELKLTERPFRTIHHCFSHQSKRMSFDFRAIADIKNLQQALPSLERAKELQFLVLEGPPPLEVPKKVSSIGFLCEFERQPESRRVSLSAALS